MKRCDSLSLNDHPHDGIRPHEHNYDEFAKALGVNPKERFRCLTFPIRTIWRSFSVMRTSLRKISVSISGGLTGSKNYLYPYVAGHNSTSLRMDKRTLLSQFHARGKRGAGYSRWAGWGDHRNPIQFSGDAQANWPMLAFEVKLTACSGQGGCYYWAHDIGGFRGEPNPELTTRWTQFGALSAALRVHSTKDKKLDRRPWISGKKETEAMRRMYHFRSQLMPYIYSNVWHTHNTMVPLNRSMFIDFGSQKESFDQPQQFMFGDVLMAAPITSPEQERTKLPLRRCGSRRGGMV